MSGAVLAPFLVMWIIVKMFLPDEMYDLGVTVSMVAWLAWVVILWAWSKSDASNYIVFPQSKWKFPDGTCRTFDLKVPTDSWEKIVEYPDGAVGYNVLFADKYAIDDPDLPFPIIFDSAKWILPDLWDVSFQRRAYGEFFHKGVFVTKPDCEDISVYVLGYEENQGQRFPICLINDCALTYAKAYKDYNLPALLKGDNPIYLLFRTERQKALKLEQHTAFLEDSVKVLSEDNPSDFKKSADRRINAIRKRHGGIMDTNASILSKILNLKTVAIVLLVLAGAYFIGHFFFGVW
jgi:hypothetical protein